MDANYWKLKWEENDIRFHQDQTNPLLEKYFQSVKGQSVFVPLCGKSRDMDWLVEQGMTVVGVELSELAVRSFFAERESAFLEKEQHGFRVFESKNLVIWCGDIFALPAYAVSNCSLVYDRAALIALPQAMRERYAEKLGELFPRKLSMLLITLEYPQGEVKPPPFSVDAENVNALFGKFFRIDELVRLIVGEARNPKFNGISPLVEPVYLLTK